jgi:hypothetical protein
VSAGLHTRDCREYKRSHLIQVRALKVMIPQGLYARVLWPDNCE